MEYRTLGNTDLQVSVICLGTMTWGEQNTEQDAHEQMTLAFEEGVNFIDAAEMYPVPANGQTQGRTESHIGTWMQSQNNRDQVVLATKVAGRSPNLTWLRDGQEVRLNRSQIEYAIEQSLKRLQTDYIDLYQVHWPERRTNFFGQLGYVAANETQNPPIAIEETLGVLKDLMATGKVRHIGISNETPWGVMQYLNLAESKQYPRVMSIQNPYSLLNRSFEVGLAEMAIRGQCGLLAYSPLGFGTLSGKYVGGAQPKGARLTKYSQFPRYSGDPAQQAVEKYTALANAHGLSPAQMALSFVNSRPFVTSTIIGATTVAQLKENIGSIDVTLTDDVLTEIDAIHMACPNPCP